MKNKSTLFGLLSFFLLLLASCGSVQNIPNIPKQTTVQLELKELPTANQFVNLDYGIIIKVNDKRANNAFLSRYDVSHNFTKPIIETYPDIRSFVDESVKTYTKTLGFTLESDVNVDYLLEVNIQQFQVSFLSGIGWMGTVVLDIQVFDNDRRPVMPVVTVTGRNQSAGTQDNFILAGKVINQAYKKALDEFPWSKLAFFLKVSDHASAEGNKRVSGDGNTALENMVIRWFVDSAPKGADVYWRVVSSTPNVKNTNMNFLGSTPFESTETFDIMGLTYNVAGNVQIEISCEKPGYIRQTRRFNLRQVIDQKEISTKFNLIKEE